MSAIHVLLKQLGINAAATLDCHTSVTTSSRCAMLLVSFMRNQKHRLCGGVERLMDEAHRDIYRQASVAKGKRRTKLRNWRQIGSINRIVDNSIRNYVYARASDMANERTVKNLWLTASEVSALLRTLVAGASKRLPVVSGDQAQSNGSNKKRCEKYALLKKIYCWRMLNGLAYERKKSSYRRAETDSIGLMSINWTSRTSCQLIIEVFIRYRLAIIALPK